MREQNLAPVSLIYFYFALLWLLCLIGNASAAEVEVLPNYVLKYSQTTSASKESIWRLWQDVENWKKFDTLLEYSSLDKGQKFATGASGVIKAEGATKTRFELTEVKPGVSFIEKLKLPLFQSIELHRYFEKSASDATVFSHEVRFKGRLRFLIYFAAAATFKKELPLVMSRLSRVAELEEMSKK